MMKLLLLLLTFSAPIYADPPTVDKTARMTEIETKYHVQIVGILRHGKTEYWVFMEHQTETGTALDGFPVVIPKNGSDHDMEIATIAAENCAAFYETELKEALPSDAGASIKEQSQF